MNEEKTCAVSRYGCMLTTLNIFAHTINGTFVCTVSSLDHCTALGEEGVHRFRRLLFRKEQSIPQDTMRRAGPYQKYLLGENVREGKGDGGGGGGVKERGSERAARIQQPCGERAPHLPRISKVARTGMLGVWTRGTTRATLCALEMALLCYPFHVDTFMFSTFDINGAVRGLTNRV